MSKATAANRALAIGKASATGASAAQYWSTIVSDARVNGRRAIDEVSCKKILAGYGVAVPQFAVVRGGDDLARALHSLRPPWVVKVVSPDVIHKTEVGGVQTGLADIDSVATAMAAMGERLHSRALRVDGFLVEEMAPAGIEVVMGGVRDASFGWLLMFGIGGILVEYLQDIAFRICPITRLDALDMVRELRTAPILAGARGRPGVHEAALVDALLAIGGDRGLLMQAGDEIAEVDVNPLIASEHGVVAVDARIILADD